MFHMKRLRLGEMKCASLEVTELQVEMGVGPRSLTPELKGSSSTVCLVFAEDLGSGARRAGRGEF